MFGDIVRSRKIAYTAAFIALITLGGWISIPFFPVPFTLQTFFILLAGAVMKRNAVVPVVLYVLLGAVGLPIYHNGMAGIGVLLGPTGGYLAGFIVGALIAGFACEVQSSVIRITGLFAASVVILLCGAGWLALSAGMTPVAALMAGMVIFLPGDAVKTIAAYFVSRHLP